MSTTIRHRIHLSALALCAWFLLFSAAPLRAQETTRWVFAPVVAPNSTPPQWMAGALDELAAAADAKGISTWARDEAADAFARKHSRDPESITQEDVRTLQRLYDTATKSLAAQHVAAALEELDAAGRIYRRAPDSFNRTAPQQVLDLCLRHAQALVESGVAVVRVTQSIRECRMRVPLEIETNLLLHTNATVRKTLVEVSNEISNDRKGRLEVRGRDGCQVRVDGIDSGRIQGGKLTFHKLIVGSHRVSLACDSEPMRVYRVEVSEESKALTIDASFDATLRSVPYLYFQSADDERIPDIFHGSAVDTVSPSHIRAVQAALGHATLVLVGSNRGAYELLRVSPSGNTTRARLRGPSQIGEAWSAEELGRAIADLLASPAPEASTSPGASVSSNEPAARAPLPSGPHTRGVFTPTQLRRQRRASFALISIGLAGAATTTALALRSNRLRSENQELYYDQSGSRVESTANRLRTSYIVLAPLTIGAALPWALQMALAIRFDQRKSNLALSLPLLAAGGALLGLAFALPNDACRECYAERDIQGDRNALLFISGLGLAMAPVIHGLFVKLPTFFVERRERKRAKLALGPGSLRIEGSF